MPGATHSDGHVNRDKKKSAVTFCAINFVIIANRHLQEDIFEDPSMRLPLALRTAFSTTLNTCDSGHHGGIPSDHGLGGTDTSILAGQVISPTKGFKAG